MSVDYFEHQENVATNLILFLRERGYSRLSLSKLTGVPRTALDQLLGGWNGDVQEYNEFIEKIRIRFDLPMDYFIKEVALPQSSATILSPEVQELQRGLADVLDIYSMYI
ncbi:hypothetical protein M3647_21120 [Paenibacillus cellulositrophicus]|uniref:hypothetical protein n=1 Tax=Paenibacillus cellulositrophicus TaxID=562959 RepID=UPI00203C4078|nr:hypothetical protein [Paenibacillus cellulositrophicus]MCM2999980.1 hypothetical protein [Paenibacillus cellulositrophicus]